MGDVFISCSRKDHKFVEKLAGALNTAWRDVWIDVLGIRASLCLDLIFASILVGKDEVAPSKAGQTNYKAAMSQYTGWRYLQLRYRDATEALRRRPAQREFEPVAVLKVAVAFSGAFCLSG